MKHFDIFLEFIFKMRIIYKNLNLNCLNMCKKEGTILRSKTEAILIYVNLLKQHFSLLYVSAEKSAKQQEFTNHSPIRL